MEMNKLIVIEKIPVILPEKEILARLKYNIHKTIINEESLIRIQAAIKKGFLACEPKGSWIRSTITERSADTIAFENGITFRSASVSDLLAGSTGAVFMGATTGRRIVDIAEKSFRDGDAASAVIYDAVGSETADAAIDWINKYIAREVKRMGEKLTAMRFSPGYGDFMLENQRQFFELLKLENFGVKLTDRYIFVPEKTVTAIAGVEK